jgi:molybdate transport system regulatory protein
MKISARNVLPGKITGLKHGSVNAEVELTTGTGDKIIAIVTEGSVAALGLAVGKDAVAVVKAPWVTVLTEASGVRFSARNQLSGTVNRLEKGAINTEVCISLPGGTELYAVITNEAAAELGLKAGAKATALIKASHVMLGVSA